MDFALRFFWEENSCSKNDLNSKTGFVAPSGEMSRSDRRVAPKKRDLLPQVPFYIL